MSSKTSKLPARLTVTLVSVFLVLLGIHLAGVGLLRYLVEKELHPALPQGTYIGEVQLNLFSGMLRIEDFQLRRDDELRMRLGSLLLEISPSRLLTGAIHIKRVELANGYLRIDRRSDGSFDLGLPPFASPAASTADRHPLALSLAGATLERFTVEYHDGDFASNAHIDNLKVGAYSKRAASQDIALDAQLRWDGRNIVTELSLSLDDGQIGAAGRLQTELLDLARAQRLAGLEPQVSGEAAFQGEFAWRAPRLTLAGAVQAPGLLYRLPGGQVSLSDLRFPHLDLNFVIAPSLTAELAARRGARVEAWEWQTEQQTAAASGVSVSGRWRYADAGQVEVSGLELQADSLDWRAGGRLARLADVNLSGSLQQATTGGATLPTAAVQLAAAALAFTDDDTALTVELADVAVSDLTLVAAAADAGARDLAAKLSAAASRVAQADTAVQWAALAARLQGAVGGADTAITTDLSFTDLAVTAPSLAQGALEIGAIVADDVRLGEQSTIGRLRLDAVRLPGELPETGLRIAAVEAAEGRFSATTGVAVGEIVINGLQSGVIRDRGGRWRHVASAIEAPADGGAGSAERPAPTWRIAGLRVTGDSYVDAVDFLNPDSPRPRFQIERLQIGALASDTPNADTPFSAVLRPDRYSEFVIDGKVRPLAKNLLLKAQGHLHGFGLTSVNGLVANDLGHRFLDGQMDDEFTISIDRKRLEVANALRLAGVAVEEIPGKEGPPLAAAIALLEDHDGNINLEVPVAGDLADPKFRVLGALNPIIMKAVAGTAALAIQPLGSVLLVGSLLADQALKVTFEPALFDAGSTQLNPAAQTYLAQLAAKLQEKPKLAVRICGVVAESERKKDKQGAYLDNQADLLATAQLRADAARAYLADKGARQKQLRSCRPSVDARPEGRPRVDIKF